ncbi:hypothetical protein [Dactylosporangium cerinum]
MELAERVACEDVVMFVNAAVTSTGQREFHAGAAEQRLSLAFLHEYVLVNYRELYAATLALDVNDFNAGLVVLNLLRTAQAVPLPRRKLEGALIAAKLRDLPPQRVYRILRTLRAEGINNRRTRAIVRDWVAGRPDIAFDAVKYRRHLAGAARHAHVRLPDEVGTMLFDWRRPKRYSTPILETWRRAHYDQRAVFDLPYTVAEGFAAKHRINRARLLTRNGGPRLTALERLRLEGDLHRIPLTRLAVYALSLPRPERARRRDELTGALRAAARRAAGRRAGTWGTVVGVLDDSYSASGSGVKRRRPSRSRSPCTTCSRRSPRGTTRSGSRTPATRCWCTRSGRRRWVSGSSTGCGCAPTGWSWSPTAGTTRRPGRPRRCCGCGTRSWIPKGTRRSCTSTRCTTATPSTCGASRRRWRRSGSVTPRTPRPSSSWPGSPPARRPSHSCARTSTTWWKGSCDDHRPACRPRTDVGRGAARAAAARRADHRPAAARPAA